MLWLLLGQCVGDSCSGSHNPEDKYRIGDHASVKVDRYVLACKDEEKCTK